MGDEWTETTLGDVADLLSGGTPPKDRADYWSGSIPWVSAKDMKRFRIEDTEDHVTVEGAKNGTKVVPAGTVLLLVRGMTLLNDLPICVAGQAVAFNQDVKALRPKLGVRNEFLPYLLLGHKARLLSSVDLAGHGTGRLNSDEIKRLDVLLPPEQDQRAIANILATLDDKIEMNRRMNETLEAMSRALFNSWFVEFGPVRAKAEGRYPGLPKPLADLFPSRLVDSEFGEIPEGWDVKEIGDLAVVVGGSTPKTDRVEYWEGGRHHWVTPKDLSPLSMPVLLDTERKITDSGLSQISSGLLPKGTVLLSSRAPIGYLAITEVPVAVNQGFIALKPRVGTSNLFLLRWASSAHDDILSRANGSTFLEISKSNFRAIRVVAPGQPVMRAFDRLSGSLYQAVVERERESRTLRAVRDIVLPKLISGELRVRGASGLLDNAASC